MMLKTLALTAAIALTGVSLAMAHGGAGGHGPIIGGHFGGHFGGFPHGGGRFWHGRWWGYGSGPCWSLTPVGYVWVCN